MPTVFRLFVTISFLTVYHSLQLRNMLTALYQILPEVRVGLGVLLTKYYRSVDLNATTTQDVMSSITAAVMSEMIQVRKDKKDRKK